MRGDLSDVSGTCYLNDRAAYVRIPHRSSLECGHIEKAVYIGRESVADIRPLSFVSDGRRGAPRSMLAACTTSTVLQLVRGVKPHARHPIVHLFTLLLLPLEGYWESGTLGLATAKPNARLHTMYAKFEGSRASSGRGVTASSPPWSGCS